MGVHDPRQFREQEYDVSSRGQSASDSRRLLTFAQEQENGNAGAGARRRGSWWTGPTGPEVVIREAPERR